MRYLKNYKKFNEDGNATVSASTSGMGAVVSSQPGGLPGTTGTEGSGDVGFTFKKERRKKGDPSKVTDMRDLEPAKGVTKVKDIKESLVVRKRDPRYDDDTKDIIEDCLLELYDDNFVLNSISYSKNTETVDVDEDSFGYADIEELKVSVYKQIKKKWTGNIKIKKYFDKKGVNNTNVSTLRASGSSLTEDEQELSDLSEDIANKLINLLDYEEGIITIDWLVNLPGQADNAVRNINCNLHFELNNTTIRRPSYAF